MISGNSNLGGWTEKADKNYRGRGRLFRYENFEQKIENHDSKKDYLNVLIFQCENYKKI